VEARDFYPGPLLRVKTKIQNEGSGVAWWMASKKDPQGITLRKYGNLIRNRWPLKKGWVIGATVARNSDVSRPIHQWKLYWTVTKGARGTADKGGKAKGRRITPKGTYCGPDEFGAVFSTAHEAYLLYYQVLGKTPGSGALPPKSNPSVSSLDPQQVIRADELSDIIDEVIEKPKPKAKLKAKPKPKDSPSIDVLDEQPFKETRPVSSEVSPLRNRAHELLYAYSLMGTDLEALEQEMESFSVVFNSTRELRTTQEARLLALAVAGKLTPTELEKKIGIPKRDTYCFEHKETKTKISLVGAYFRCTSCHIIKPGSAFGVRRMQDGIFRNQAQCGECRSVHSHSHSHSRSAVGVSSPSPSPSPGFA